MTVEKLKGPGGWWIELDSGQIFPKDPGLGTPAMIYSPGQKLSGTWFCYEGEGMVDGEEPPEYVRNWLNDPRTIAAVDSWLSRNNV